MNVRREVSLINKFGEKMTLALDVDNQIWFKHDDCNDEYENMKNLCVTYELGGKTFEGFKYIVNPMEEVVINQFIAECLKEVENKTPLIKVG